MKEHKINFELVIVDLIKKGFRPSQIAKQLNVSLSRLSYHLSSLKIKGMIKKKGYGVWEIDPIGEAKRTSNSSNIANSQVSNSVRGHAFIWKVQARKLKNLDWKKLLNERKILYEEKGLAKYPRIMIKGKKVILGKKNIVIYEPNSFFARNSIESRKYAVFSLLETLRTLEDTLGIQIRGFRFTPTKEHFSLIKNELARQCNKEGEKINIFNEKGHWLSIDDSYNLEELETLGIMENKPMETNLELQKWWNEQKETKFQVSPTFILNTMNGIQQNQLVFAENMRSHIKAVQDLGKGVNQLVKITREIKEENKHLKQRRLSEFS